MNEDKRYAIHVDVTMLNQNYLCIGKTMSLYFLTNIFRPKYFGTYFRCEKY